MPTQRFPCVHALVIEQWAAEIAALPERKRSKWSTATMEADGVYHKIRYHNGQFEKKVHNDGRLDHLKVDWMPIIPMGGEPTAEQVLRIYGVEAAEAQLEGGVPQSFIGGVPLLPQDFATERGMLATHAAVQDDIDANYTGNHYRNKTVRVPTKVGQPVRG
jgi:hypothetical protein